VNLRNTPSNLIVNEAFNQAAIDLAVTLTEWTVRKRGYHFHSLGLSVRDVAYDAIAELLSESEDDQLSPLQRSLSTALGDDTDPEAFHAHIQAILLGTIHRNLTRIFAEYDPVYAKMLRMLRIHIRKSDSIHSKQSVSGYLYFRLPEDQILLRNESLPLQDLKTRIQLPDVDGNPSVVALIACLDYLESQSTYRRAVSESDVMKVAMEMIGNDLRAITHDHEQAFDDNDRAKIEESVESAITATRKWAVDKYVQKGKLSLREVEAMMQSIRMYVSDLAEGGAESHYYYLRQHLTGLSYDRFRKDYRNTYEYIVRTFFTKAQSLLVSLGYENPMEMGEEMI
jgi:hypothetical protein